MGDSCLTREEYASKLSPQYICNDYSSILNDLQRNSCIYGQKIISMSQKWQLWRCHFGPAENIENICSIAAAFTVIWHGENGDLSDGTVSALHSAGTLVDGGQISVHVARKASTAGHFLSGSRDLQVGRGWWMGGWHENGKKNKLKDTRLFNVRLHFTSLIFVIWEQQNKRKI